MSSRVADLFIKPSGADVLHSLYEKYGVAPANKDFNNIVMIYKSINWNISLKSLIFTTNLGISLNHLSLKNHLEIHQRVVFSFDTNIKKNFTKIIIKNDVYSNSQHNRPNTFLKLFKPFTNIWSSGVMLSSNKAFKHHHLDFVNYALLFPMLN